MGIFGKVFGQKANAAKTEIKKFEKRDLMEALVGGCSLIAFADGACDAGELKATEDLLRTNKALEAFGHEINDTLNRFSSRLTAGYRVARMEILREIEQVKGDRQDAEDVLLTMLTIAEASGGIDEKEEKELTAVCDRLGLRLSDYA